MMVILILLGFFIDQTSIMMITLPFFMPLVQQLGVDLVWFGMLFLICMQIGLLTPPFGLLLFVMKGVAPPHITIGEIIGAVIPYLYLGIAVMLLVFSVAAACHVPAAAVRQLIDFMAPRTADSSANFSPPALQIQNPVCTRLGR